MRRKSLKALWSQNTPPDGREGPNTGTLSAECITSLDRGMKRGGRERGGEKRGGEERGEGGGGGEKRVNLDTHIYM